MSNNKTEKEMLESVFYKLKAIETELTSKHSGNNKIKYKIFALFSDIRKFLDYRNELQATDISDDKHTWRCPKCETLIESELSLDTFEFCPICGQRINKEGTFENYILSLEENDG